MPFPRPDTAPAGHAKHCL
jgi:Arf-GAP/SH3 domain/ANK repeat/PH domain-containing protein